MSADITGISILPVSEHGYPETFVGIVAIAVFYWIRYNLWTEGQAGYGPAGLPRQFTTWARFMSSAVVYTLLMEIVYLVLITAPDAMRVVWQQAGPASGPFAMDRPGGAFPLWVAVFLLGFCPYLPVVGRVEESCRRWFHRWALIPVEAMALVQQLLINPAAFNPDEKVARQVIARYGRDMPGGWESIESDDRLAGQWFRLVYLRERLEEWRTYPHIAKFIWQIESEYEAFQAQFRQLTQDVITYTRYGHSGNGDPDGADPGPSLQEPGNSIMQRIDKTLKWSYEITVRGILSTERTHSGRTAVLNYFGLNPASSGGVPVMWDLVFKIGIIGFFINTLTSMGFLAYLSLSGQLSLYWGTGLVWAAFHMLLIVICIFVAMAVFRGLVLRRGFDAGIGGGLPVIPSFAHLWLGAITGYLSGLLLAFLAMYIFMDIWSVSRLSMWETLVQALPWPLMPAVTSGFVAYYLAGPTLVGHRFRGIFVQGLVSGAAGLVACLWAFNSLPYEWGNTWAYGVYYVTTSIFVGGAIGYYFPRAYGHRVAQMRAGRS